MVKALENTWQKNVGTVEYSGYFSVLTLKKDAWVC